MQKIGVITFSNATDNYGQVLQYLATQEFLKSQGYYAALLRLSGYRSVLKRLFFEARSKLSFLCHKIQARLFGRRKNYDVRKRQKDALFQEWAKISNRREAEHSRCFGDFKNRNFNVFRGTYEDVVDAGFSVFCAGSDQIWAWADSYTLLSWAPAGAKRISIASSVGHWDFSATNLSRQTKWLKDFLFITVREENGLEFCRRCGRADARKVLDPTFLLAAEDYDRYAILQPKTKPYVLIYMLGGEIEMGVADIIAFVNARGYDVRYVESQGRDEKMESINATVEDWLGLMHDADYVITNSFHGMAFSIIYRKPFLVFPLVGVMDSMNGRIYDLAGQMDLKSRIYAGSLEALFRTVNWSYANVLIAENKRALCRLAETLKV